MNHMRKTNKTGRQRGFALISILLASVMGLGAVAAGVFYYKETSAKTETNDLSTSFNLIGASISNRMDVINRYHDAGGLDPRIVLGIDGLPGFTFHPDGTMEQPWARGGVSLQWIQTDVVQFSLAGLSDEHCKRIVPKMWGTTYNPGFNSYAMIGGHLISGTTTSAIDAINRFCKDDVSVGVVIAIDRLAAADAIGDDTPILLASNDATGSTTGSTGATSTTTDPGTSSSTTTPGVTTGGDDPQGSGTDGGTGVTTDTGATAGGDGSTGTVSDTGSSAPRDPGGATGTASSPDGSGTTVTDPGDADTTNAPDDTGTDPQTEGASDSSGSTDQGAGTTTGDDPGATTGGATTGGDAGDGTLIATGPTDSVDTGSTGSDTPGTSIEVGGSTGPVLGTIDNPIPLDLKFPKGKGTTNKTVMSNNLATLPDGTSVAFQNLKVWGEGDPTLRLANGQRGTEGVVGANTNVQVGRGECGVTGVFYLQDQSGTIYSYDVSSVGCK